MRTTCRTGRFYKNGWQKHNRHIALLKAKSSTSAVVIGESIATGLMRYRNVLDENFKRDDKKLALSVETKLDNRVNCHRVTINEKVVPTIKAVDYQRADYRRAITISSRNRQSNSNIERNIKVQSTMPT